MGLPRSFWGAQPPQIPLLQRYNTRVSTSPLDLLPIQTPSKILDPPPKLPYSSSFQAEPLSVAPGWALGGLQVRILSSQSWLLVTLLTYVILLLLIQLSYFFASNLYTYIYIAVIILLLRS